MPTNLIEPHGGRLVELATAYADRRDQLQAASKLWPSWSLTPRQLCDLELLVSGGFSPLTGFMTKSVYESVCQSMRLPSGDLWPIPITLDLPADRASGLAVGSMLALRDPEGVMLAALEVEEVWEPNREAEASRVFGTTSTAHPGVAQLLERTNTHCVGGTLASVSSPRHYDFQGLRQTPRELRAAFARLGWRRIAAFQPPTPMHRMHQEQSLRAARACTAHLLIHPIVGDAEASNLGAADLLNHADLQGHFNLLGHYGRIRSFEAALPSYPEGCALLSLLPLATRLAGPREALLHAIVHKNYGCSHVLVGRHHASPRMNARGPGKDHAPFYGAHEAHELVSEHAEELGVVVVPVDDLVFLPGDDRFCPTAEVPEGSATLEITETEVRQRLAEGRPLPEWFTPPEVASQLRRHNPPRAQRGFTVFFTGLSGSGKSTLANVLRVKLLERGGRDVTLLDGDVVRTNLSSELGFSKAHRDLNIQRIGFVASEITKYGGIAICAPIAPYAKVRGEVRARVEALGGFFLVHVATSLAVCERRDRKGLYAKARAGIIKEFTGISDPYEAPADAEITIDTALVSAEEGAQRVIRHLIDAGYLATETLPG